MKSFNTAGKCIPSMHFMVDISRQVDSAAKLVREGKYFCINRGRQYGKTTTLAMLKKKLEDEGVSVFSLSFEGLGSKSYVSIDALLYTTVKLMLNVLKWNGVKNLSDASAELIKDSSDNASGEMDSITFMDIISTINSKDHVVLLIDEVDQAGNYPEFIKFLGILRDMYLNRDERPTFQSVILAGVYDVKNLKMKMRSDEQHQYNSPWNIAVQYNVDMSLSADGISDMLSEYKNERGVDFDENNVGQMIYDYTSGYPFLVSRICEIIDTEGYTWDKDGVLKAVNSLLKEANTLFDDIAKKVAQFPNLGRILKAIIFGGQRVAFNYYDNDINLAAMFDFVKEKDGATLIYCRIFETWLYNLFISNDKESTIFQKGELDKNQFVHDGFIDMKLLLEKFAIHFNEIYRTGHDDKFVEDNGRQIFLTYLRPIINGIGNYYCESQTRDLTRTDVIIDYLGQQYVIELKIWRGNAYNERGEKQLSEYLDYYHLKTGYMVSFCFNKNKHIGVNEVLFGEHKLIEAIV